MGEGTRRTGTGGERGGFRLIESMLWSAETSFYLLELHIERLKSSSAYFGFAFDEAAVRKKLAAVACGLEKQRKYKVRLLLSKDGALELGGDEITEAPAGRLLLPIDGKPELRSDEPGVASADRMLLRKDGRLELPGDESGVAPSGRRPRVALAAEAVDSADVFLYHKTTRREQYDRALKLAADRGLYDLLFRNERGELTEGARNNIVARIAGRLVTPPVSCGLLNGVFRRHLLSAGLAGERVLRAEDLSAAESLYCCNSVRGMVEVALAAGEEMKY